jgi:hypothetical protein
MAATALSYVAATASLGPHGPRPNTVSDPVIKGVSYDADGDPLVTREDADGTLAASPLSPEAPVDQLLRETLLLHRSN